MEDLKKTQTQSTSNQYSQYDFDDSTLEATLDEFMEDTPEVKKNDSIWNFKSIAGLSVLGVSSLYMFQFIVNSFFGGALDIVDSEFMQALPIISGVLVTVIGLGIFRKNKDKEYKISARKAKRIQKAKMKAERKRMQEDHKYESRRKSRFESANYNNTEFQRTDKEEPFNVKNDFEDSYKYSSRRSQSEATYSSNRYDEYALSKTKKLYKSRKDKALTGLIGGVAKYIGINSSILRVLFLISVFMTGGTSLMIYFILSWIVPKEPFFFLDEEY